MGRLWWPSHLFGRWMTCGCAIRKEILWNLKRRKGVEWRAPSVITIITEELMSPFVKSRVLLCHLYISYTTWAGNAKRECVNRCFFFGMFFGTKISFLLTWECSYSVFNKRCCYLSFFLSYLRHGKMEFGKKQKQIGCGQKLHKWVNIHMNFCFFLFWGCRLSL